MREYYILLTWYGDSSLEIAIFEPYSISLQNLNMLSIKRNMVCLFYIKLLCCGSILQMASIVLLMLLCFPPPSHPFPSTPLPPLQHTGSGAEVVHCQGYIIQLTKLFVGNLNTEIDVLWLAQYFAILFRDIDSSLITYVSCVTHISVDLLNVVECDTKLTLFSRVWLPARHHRPEDSEGADAGQASTAGQSGVGLVTAESTHLLFLS